MATQRRFYYGWIMMAAGFLCYGFGLAPAYTSWGFYGPELIADLGISRFEVGLVFGLFGLIYSIAAPISAWSIGRFGLRPTMTLGFLLSAVGFFMLSRSRTIWDCYYSYSLLGGLGVGLAAMSMHRADR